jgi:ATP-dependent DNA helicase DinG
VSKSPLTLKAIFGEEGLLARSLPYYEFRPGQIEMSEVIAKGLREHRHVIVEAGTGVGKTLAYLIPAILSGKKVVVSTGTKNLQEQLYLKDIPFLEKHLPVKFKATYMKGRNNYLCVRRFTQFRQQGALFQDDAVQFQNIVKWAHHTQTGDRSELSDLPDNSPLWREISSTVETCLGAKCEYFATKSFTAKVKRAAGMADIIIVNHHLFFADLALKAADRGEAIPPYDVVIFDEAHQLEEIATTYFSVLLSNYGVEELIKDVGKELNQAEVDGTEVIRTLDALQKQSEQFFTPFAARNLFQKPSFSHRVADGVGKSEKSGITGVTGVPPRTDSKYRLSSDNLPELSMKILPDLLNTLNLLETLLKGLRKSTEGLQTQAERAAMVKNNLTFIMEVNQSGYVYWCETRGKWIGLGASPIDVSDDMRQNVFRNIETVILTSATLSTAGGSSDKGNFQFLKDRLGIEDCLERIVPSPFDYEKQAILYIPRLMPDPRDPGFVEAVAREIEGIINKTRGRAFVLFTSYKNMEETYLRLRSVLKFPLLKQGEAGKSFLLERFKAYGNAVLFATSSFWQGIDVQGEALSCVIIDKLPFTAPSEPLLEARIENLKAQDRDPFSEYQVPSAVITLKQGLGRLIRSKKDTGVLSILDTRILTKSYGRAFLKSLPKCRITRRLEEVNL